MYSNRLEFFKTCSDKERKKVTQKNQQDDFELRTSLSKLSAEREIFLNSVSQQQGQVMLRYCRHWEAMRRARAGQEVSQAKPVSRPQRWLNDDHMSQQRLYVEMWRKQAKKQQPSSGYYETNSTSVSLRSMDDLLKKQDQSIEDYKLEHSQSTARQTNKRYLYK